MGTIFTFSKVLKMNLPGSGGKVTYLILVSVSSKQIPQNNASYVNCTKMLVRTLLWEQNNMNYKHIIN